MEFDHIRQDQLDRALSDGDWQLAELLLRELTSSCPSSHWAASRLAVVLSELGRHDEATRTSDLAYQLCPNCPLVLWDRSCVLAASGNLTESVRLLTVLVSFGLDEVRQHPCSEGDEWAIGLFDDAIVEVVKKALAIGHRQTALRYLNMLLDRTCSAEECKVPAGVVQRLSALVVASYIDPHTLRELLG